MGLQLLYSQQTSCESTVDSILPKLVASLDKNDFVATTQFLENIEASCGNNEVIQRVRIISDMIQKKNTSTIIADYLNKDYDQQLIKRLDAAAAADFEEHYEKKKATFHFVPLNHSLDSLVMVKSVALLQSSSYTLNEQEETIAFLFSDHVETYLSRTQKVPSEVETYSMSEDYAAKYATTIGLSAGVYTPVNAVNPVFGRTPIFGLSITGPYARNWIWSGVFQVRPNSKGKYFDFSLWDEIHEINSAVSFIIGGTVGRKLYDSGRFLVIADLGIGYEAATTGLSETVEYDYYDEYGNSNAAKFYTLNTVNLSSGISLVQQVGSRNFIGVKGGYHYAPYSLSSRLKSTIYPHFFQLSAFFNFSI